MAYSFKIYYLYLYNFKPFFTIDFSSRNDLINYAKKNKIIIPKDKKGASPFSEVLL